MADRNAALNDYKDGLSYKEIADKHGVSESTVKSWASRFWNKNKRIKAARSKAKKLRSKTKKSCNLNGKDKLQLADEEKPEEKIVNKGGAPPGNQNSKGHRNAEKHGGYSKVYWDVLDSEELAMIKDVNTDEEYQLEEQLKLFIVRERRILKAIDSVKRRTNKSGDIEVSSVVGLNFEEKENMSISSNGECFPTTTVKPAPKWANKSYEKSEFAVIRLEKELTSVQRSKTRVINSLAEIRRIKGGNNDDWLDDFFSAVDEVNNE